MVPLPETRGARIPAVGSPWARGGPTPCHAGGRIPPRGFSVGARYRDCPSRRAVWKGLVDHETTRSVACGDAVLTGATQTNANDLVIVAVR